MASLKQPIFFLLNELIMDEFTGQTALITGAAQEELGPGITFLPIQFGHTHPHFFNGNIMKGIRWADRTAAHTEVARSFFWVDLRSTCQEKIEAAPHIYAVENTHLGTLPALQTT